ncbi:MAG: HD domain-containing protein [Clostridia bacterium]|nr:HD domain-containing protein [Clostridia bacterium]MDD4375241.1 HD domain-containing protein [Clostridia bacterium]
MLIDDDIGMMEAMRVVLKKYSILVSPYTEPIAALENLKNNPKKYDILIINYLMNPVRGDEIVKLVREFNNEIYIILMSGHKELTPSIDVMRSLDIQAYFEKSSRIDQLVLLIESGFKYINSIDNIKTMSRTIELHAIEIADILKNTVGAKDNYTKYHSDRVALYAKMFGTCLGLSEDDLNTLALAAQFHDIGKIGIADNILLKNGKLTESEYEHVKLHTTIGPSILSSSEVFKKALPLIKHHHEQYDGNGYPDGLKGDSIPYLVRILSICDTFDAITGERPYKEAKSIEFGLEEMKKNIGVQFDADLIEKFVDCINLNIDEVNKIHRSSIRNI